MVSNGSQWYAESGLRNLSSTVIAIAMDVFLRRRSLGSLKVLVDELSTLRCVRFMLR